MPSDTYKLFIKNIVSHISGLDTEDIYINGRSHCYVAFHPDRVAEATALREYTNGHLYRKVGYYEVWFPSRRLFRK